MFRWLGWLTASGVESQTYAATFPAPGTALVVALQSDVQVLRAGARTRDLAYTNLVLFPGDQLITGAQGRALILTSDRTTASVAPDSIWGLARTGGPASGLYLWRGLMHLLHRDQPGFFRFETPSLFAGARGTEFVLEVEEDGTSRLAVLDGEVEIWSQTPGGHDPPLSLTQGTEGEVRPGGPPGLSQRKVDARLIQWVFYYPAVLSLEDLALSDDETEALRVSLANYREGDLVQALATLPDDTPPSARIDLYRAALLAANSDIAGAERWLDHVEMEAGPPALRPLAGALRRVIAAVLSTERTAGRTPRTATEHLADSHYLQSRGDLTGAREAAQQAVASEPGFAFALSRLAELEFGFAEVAKASRSVQRSLELAKRYPAAWSIRGFLHSAQNRMALAQEAFERAIQLDSGLGQAWLGRGLCRIRRGDLEGGRADLLIAAAMDPQRSAFRSYLAKAFIHSKPFREPPLAGRAAHELDRALALDPEDPTPWLYSALRRQQENQINPAIEDVGQSLALGQGRRQYRSGFLLDQDRAVRSANLANLYVDAGMAEWGVQEATHAVDRDYANAYAHRFLADSYDALRDPRQVSLRYETPWFGEFLIANLLAPVGGGSLSQTVSQNEYSRLFERDGFGAVSETLWTSNGDWQESAAQHGRFGNFEYALDALYRSEVGQRPNQDLEQVTLALQSKVQLAPSDTVFLQAIYYDAEAGDVAQYYEATNAVPGLRYTERQEPLALGGWHHEWGPGDHTLFLASPWNVRATLTDPSFQALWGGILPDGAVDLLEFDLPAQPLVQTTRFAGWSTEVQQIHQTESHTLLGGFRYQQGRFDADASLDMSEFLSPSDQPLYRSYAATPGMERIGVYAYDFWRFLPWGLLTVGVAYDHLDAPVNFTAPPLTDAEDSTDQVSPKVGLTVTPWTGATWRAAYARTLGGVSFDQSYRLEPVQVAGFTQAYRGLIPESLEGLVPAQEMQILGIAAQQRFPSRTYLFLEAQEARSSADRGVGAFLEDPQADAIVPHTLVETLDFRERTFFAGVSQLLGDRVTVGAAYRISEAELDTNLARVLDGAVHARSVLQQARLSARYHHPSGYFARWESVWNQQSNHDSAADPNYGGGPGDDFWQHNLWTGWRFFRRRAELAVGILNLTDRDYRLHPLNHHLEPYRDRTFAVSARFDL